MRLTSLQDAPDAFSSTFESALNRSPQSWQEQAEASAKGPDRATLLAFSGDTPVGFAALYPLPAEPDTGEVFQVWVAPELRGKFIANGLMDALFA